MRIASWNVNSIHQRLPRLLDWLRRRAPDVVCLQETKTRDEAFPVAALAEAGYRAAYAGQPAYNGVAVLARAPLADVVVGGLPPPPGGGGDPQARLVAARVGGVRVLSVYVPNGHAVGHEKCAYKLAWLARLRAHLAAIARPDEPLIVAGDVNVAPRDVDVATPARWADTVLCHPEVRAAYADVLAFGLEDPFARLHPGGGVFSWWDYRRLAFARDEGLRIDVVLATAPLSRRVVAAGVDREERKGPKPSDHAPVWIELGS